MSIVRVKIINETMDTRARWAYLSKQLLNKAIMCIVGRGPTVSLTGGRVASLSGICSSATTVAPYQIAVFFTCLVTLSFASSCKTACSMLWFIHVIMSVNTHLIRRIFMAVLQS